MRNTDVVSQVTATEPGTPGRKEFVVARLGHTRLAIAADRVEAVLDGTVGAEPPCGEPWVAGWFVYRDRLWLVVRLDGRRGRRGAPTKRIVIRESEDVRFAIEVDEVYGGAVLDHVATEPFRADGWFAPDGWLKRGVAYDGTPVCSIDLDAVAERLAVNGV